MKTIAYFLKHIIEALFTDKWDNYPTTKRKAK